MTVRSEDIEQIIRMNGIESTVTMLSDGYLVKYIEKREDAFRVGRLVLGSFMEDPESGVMAEVRVRQHCDDTWSVWVRWER